MRITLIRTEKPDFTPPRRCSSAGFEEACEKQAAAGIIPCREKALDPRGRSIYVSEERRCLETAAALFPNSFLENDAASDDASAEKSPTAMHEAVKPGDSVFSNSLYEKGCNIPDQNAPTENNKNRPKLIVTPLLSAPPLSPFTDTARELPFSLWRGMAYLQWLFGNKRQKESRAESRKRAGSIIDRILSAGENAIVIADERMLSLLIAELKSRRYQIRRGGLIRIDHLERIIASDNEPHCGGCMYNCRLANPGCMIGRDKAKRAAQKQHT